MRDIDTLGGKLGPKLVRLISQTVIATKRGLGPHEAAVRSKATQDVIDAAGREIAEHYTPLIRMMLDSSDVSVSPEIRAFLEDAISGEHQLKAIGGLIMGPFGSTIGTFISNLTAPVLYEAIRTMPQLNMDVQSAVSAAASRVMTDADAANRVSEQGINNSQYAVLKELASSYPGIPDALDMLRRGLITNNTFDVILERNAVPDAFINVWAEMRRVLLSPADAALAVLRGNISQAQGAAIAAEWGVDAGDFQIVIDNTGEPPGAEQLAEALRRGFIDEATFARGIRESRIRDEWIPTMLALRYVPMSVADAVNAVVQNYLSLDQARTIANANGLEAGAVDILAQTAGEPLSRTEMEELYNRGLATESEVLQALRESRLKNKYGPQAFQLHTRLLEPRMLSSAVTVGALTHEQAIQRALEYGYSQADAAVLVNEGSANKLLTYKTRVISAAESLYEENAITAEGFLNVAKGMGFDETEANFVVQSAEFRRQSKVLTTVIAAIRSKYVAHHITKGEASGLLDATGVQANQRDFLLNYWDIELAANVRMLTEAQIVKAQKNGLITPENALDRLLGLGYVAGDAALLLEGA